jgi:ABC-type transporter Mla subunit MlaD
VDATELIKSLVERQDSTDGVLAKALSTFTGTIKTQGEMIKSLAAQVQAMSAQGRGRKTLLNVIEKPDAAALAKSMEVNKPAVMAPHDILAKCLNAQKTGALTGHDVARAEISINNGVALPADIIARIK